MLPDFFHASPRGRKSPGADAFLEGANSKVQCGIDSPASLNIEPWNLNLQAPSTRIASRARAGIMPAPEVSFPPACDSPTAGPLESDCISHAHAIKSSRIQNLADEELYFGPFTCIAGANGVGKSNLFDAITFLGALADRPLMEAAKSVRDERNHSTDVRSLFLSLPGRTVDEISFEADMLIPKVGRDDLGQQAKAAITFVRYTLGLRYRHDQDTPASERLEIVREELRQINVGDAPKSLPFRHSPQWRKSVVHGRRTAPFSRPRRPWEPARLSCIRTGERQPARVLGRKPAANRIVKHQRRRKSHGIACPAQNAVVAAIAARALLAAQLRPV